MLSACPSGSISTPGDTVPSIRTGTWTICPLRRTRRGIPTEHHPGTVPIDSLLTHITAGRCRAGCPFRAMAWPWWERSRADHSGQERGQKRPRQRSPGLPPEATPARPGPQFSSPNYRRNRRSRRHPKPLGGMGKRRVVGSDGYLREVPGPGTYGDFGIAALMASEALSAASCSDFVDKCA